MIIPTGPKSSGAGYVAQNGATTMLRLGRQLKGIEHIRRQRKVCLLYPYSVESENSSQSTASVSRSGGSEATHADRGPAPHDYR